MIINTNMASLNTIRQLGINQKATSNSLAKLSSGLRINSAADDAAGLAISEKMRGQISGLNQASSNAQTGISLTSTAEGALNETTSILQRMRELSVQAANDTSTDSDRGAMQTEVGQLKNEIDRIANTTQFNTKNLLDGSLAGAKVAQGTKLNAVATEMGGAVTGGSNVNYNSFVLTSNMTLSGQISGATNVTLNIAAGNYTSGGLATAIQTAAIAAGADASLTVNISGGKIFLQDVSAVSGASGAFSILAGNSANISGGAADTSLNDFINGAAGAATINTVAIATASGESGAVTFNAVNVITGSNDTINLKTGSQSGAVTAAAGFYTGAQLALQINTQIAASPTLNGHVTSTFIESGTSINGKMNIAATDNSAITVVSGNLSSGTGALNIAAGSTDSTITDTLLTNLADSSNNNFGLHVGDTISINGDINGSAITPTTVAISGAMKVSDLTSDIASALSLSASAVTVGTDGTIKIAGQDGTANSISNLKITAADANGNTRSLFNNAMSNFKETQAAQDTHTDTSLFFQIGANQGQTMKVDINKMDTEALSLASIDVSTQQGAENAISVIDNATNTVSSERSKLGAFQNRLEHTINNLGTSSQNITSAEANIRDVDMAAEMTNFQKNNILQQAAQAMLAQANQQPQGVLQLLR